jgi:hypothetical protein
MTTHLGLQRILLPSAQVSQLTTGSITLPSARGAFTIPAIPGYTALATAVVTSGGTSDITFSGIPTNYSNLEIRFTAKTSRTGNSLDELVMQFNADTNTANYSYARMFGGPAGTAYDENQSGFALLGLANSNTSNSQYFGQGVATIPDYASSLPKKKAVTSFGHVTHQTNIGFVYMTNGLYFGTDPVTQIKIISGSSSTILEHSRFTLYGIL